VHRKRRAFDPGLFGIGGVEYLDAVLVLLRPPDVHPHQHLGPVGGVHAAGTRADRDERFAFVVFPGQQCADFQGVDVFAQLGQFGVGFGQCVGGGRTFFLSGHLIEHWEIVDALAQFLRPAQLGLGV